MKKQAIHRLYNFPDADLYVQCMERIKYAQRDQSFRHYGYDTGRLAGVQKFVRQILGHCLMATKLWATRCWPPKKTPLPNGISIIPAT